jgi:hypothetical protein
MQDWLGHRSIQHTTRYTQLSAARRSETSGDKQTNNTPGARFCFRHARSHDRPGEYFTSNRSIFGSLPAPAYQSRSGLPRACGCGS